MNLIQSWSLWVNWGQCVLGPGLSGQAAGANKVKGLENEGFGSTGVMGHKGGLGSQVWLVQKWRVLGVKVNGGSWGQGVWWVQRWKAEGVKQWGLRGGSRDEGLGSTGVMGD